MLPKNSQTKQINNKVHNNDHYVNIKYTKTLHNDSKKKLVLLTVFRYKFGYYNSLHCLKIPFCISIYAVRSRGIKSIVKEGNSR